MKIKINGYELKNVLNLFKTFKYCKGVNKEQKSLYITTDLNNIIFQLCDNIADIQLKTILIGDVIEKGETLIPYELLSVISSIDINEIMITDNKIIYNCNSIEYISPNYDFSQLNKSPKNNIIFTIPENELYRMVKNTSYCIAKDETRPILTGLNFHGNKVAALDGFRLSISESDKFNIDKSLTLSKETINLLLRILNKKSNKAITFSISEKAEYIVICVDQIIITAKLLEGYYIKYESIILNDYRYKIIINNPKELLKKLKSMFKFKKSELEICKLTLVNSNLYIENNTSVATIKDFIDVTILKHDELPFTIAFNSIYLKDALNKYKNSISIKFSTNLSSAIIESKNNLDLILPIRIGK